MNYNLFRILLSFLMAVSFESSFAQVPEKIHKLEYFFDTDPGFGNGTSVVISPAATSINNYNFTPDITTLSNGIHILYTRVMDSGSRWSHSLPQMIYKESAIANAVPNAVAAEYFFDTDPGFGNAMPAAVTPGETVSFPINADINGLTTGLHKLYVRVKDANGGWSHSVSKLFYKEPTVSNPVPDIVQAEYYFDTDPGFGNATQFTVTQGATIIQPVTIPATGLTTGLHRLHTRVKDINGKWSITDDHLFYYEAVIPVNPIGDLVTLEWFWNTDPGFGNANTITLPAGNNGQITDFTFNVPVTANFSGTKQILYLRVLDDWSLTTAKVFDFNGILLPVTLLEFTAQARQTDVITKWKTSQEINSHHFDVEHSADGINFIKFGAVAAQGNSSVETSYELLHPNPVAGLNYYRLRQVDIDGKFTYSPVVKVLFNGGKSNIVAYPNPVRDKLTIVIPQLLTNKNLSLYMYDNKGALLLQQAVRTGNLQIDVSRYASGSYHLIIRSLNGEPVFTQMIHKQ